MFDVSWRNVRARAREAPGGTSEALVTDARGIVI